MESRRTAILLKDSGHQRPVELGPYPLEALKKDAALLEAERAHQPAAPPAPAPPETPLAMAARHYADIFSAFAEGERASQKADGSTDLDRRAAELKGAAYYLDATHAGICAIPQWAWHPSQATAHSHALVVLVAHGREVESDNPAHRWLQGAEQEIASLRALEIAACIAGHIRALGHSAQAHCAGRSVVALESLAVLAGVVRRTPAGGVASPFVGEDFALAAVATDYALAVDAPLAADAKISRLRYWWGVNGAVSGRERRRCAKRRSDLSRYPMEWVRRVDRPTTLILDDEVPRVPQRANFFVRAAHGDLGTKAQREVKRFAYKHPLTYGMMPVLRSMVPHQDGPLAAAEPKGAFADAEANTKALKSLSYHLGADLTGVCEIPDYAWYSHRPNGDPIAKRHKYAVVMLIDQGYDTMEGASGDKVVFNGYEMWKPDVERCARYRITNQKGSACGRCMKTCPLNKVVSADGALVHRLGTWLGIHAFWLKPLLVPVAVYLDDLFRFGWRNSVKRWWQDLEMIDGVAVKPRAGVNERDLDFDVDTTGRKSPVGYYHANDMPPPGAGAPVPVNHRAAVDRANLIETVDAARARHAQGGAKPAHYRPTTPAREQAAVADRP